LLTVTDKAAQFLRESLTHKKEGAPETLRIVYTQEGYQLTLDNQKEGDQIFEQEGQNYLLVDGEIGEALSDATLDVQESAKGATLTLTATGTPERGDEASEAESEPTPEPEPAPKPEA
jgi:Fe-S cluster assembly iron-binding protein IscA